MESPAHFSRNELPTGNRKNRTNIESFARAVHRVRTSLGLTQDELAEQAGLSNTGISAIETGYRVPMPPTVTSILIACGVEPLSAFFAAHEIEPPSGEAHPSAPTTYQL